jgi:hypothetical protein
MDAGLTASDVIKFVESGGTYSIPISQEDPAVISARIDAQIFEATSVEELFGEREVIHGQDYLNKPFTLVDVAWRPSDIEGQGLPFYAVLTIVTIDGEQKVLTTGARSILMKIAKAQSEGWLPLSVKIVQSDKKTENGYQPLDLVAAPAGF